MYKVRLINFDTIRHFKTFDEAVAWAIRVCFEAEITRDGLRYAVFSPISGCLLVRPLPRVHSRMPAATSQESD